MAVYTRQIANAGTTGNNTHALTEDVDADKFGFQVVIEAAGATPTVTVTLEGTLDGTNWVAIPYVTGAASTEVYTPITLTAVGTTVYWLSNASSRFYRRYRARTTANTNITYNITTAWAERPE